MLVGLPWACGRAVRAHAAEAAELRALAAALEREREAVAGLTAARERRRMAREVHDAVADVIADIRRTAVEAEQRIERRPTPHSLRGRIGREARRAVGELRAILDLLRREPDPRSLPSTSRATAPGTSGAGRRGRRDATLALAVLVLGAGAAEVALTASGAHDIVVGLALGSRPRSPSPAAGGHWPGWRSR